MIRNWSFSFQSQGTGGVSSFLLWISVAGALGLLIASQSIGIVLLLTALSFFVVAATVTPIAAIAVMVVIAPLRTLISTEAQFPPSLDIGQIAFLSLLGAWVVCRIVGGGRLIYHFWSPLTVVLFLYLLVTGFTVFSATSFSAWLNEWLKWFQIFLLIVVVQNVASERRWQWILFGLVMAGVANALIGIYEFFGGSGALHLLINDRFFRAFGTFGQPNPFGGFMGLLIPVAIMAAFGYGIGVWKVWRATVVFPKFGILLTGFYGLSAFVMLVAIGMSWSRGAWIGLIVGLVVIVFALPSRIWLSIFSFMAVLCLIGVLWFVGVLPTSIVDRLSNSTQEFFAFEDVRGVDITPENYAVVERLAHWQAALNMASANPWLGVGFGNYEVVYPQYRLINWYESLGHAHNYYLNALAETGLIGLLGYGKVWIIIIALSWRIRQHPDILARFVGIGLLGSWSYLAVHSFFDNLYVNNLFLHLGLMLGVLAVLYSQFRGNHRLEIV